MFEKVWRVYAINREGKRYIVNDFYDEDEASCYCQERNWTVTKNGRIYDLTFAQTFAKIEDRSERSYKEIAASILITLGILLLIAAGGAESLATIAVVGGAGGITATIGCDILNL